MIRKNRYRTSSPPGWGMHWSAKVIKANHTEIMLVFITVYIKDVVHLTLSLSLSQIMFISKPLWQL